MAPERIVLVPTVPKWITIDGEHIFLADVAIELDQDNVRRWNGFVASPWFVRSEAERVAAWCNADPLDIESSRFAWNGDRLLEYQWDGEPTGDVPDGYRFSRTVESPTGLPVGTRYSIGAFSWAWTEASVEAVEASGHDVGLRDAASVTAGDCRYDSATGLICRTHGPAFEDEPDVPSFDPGPEVDDEGGMSEYRHQFAPEKDR